MDDVIRQLAAAQLAIVSHWQLAASGATDEMIHYRVHRHCWQVVHRGVFALTPAPLSREQRWMAATLTTPHSYLSFGSAGARYGIHRWNKPYEVVTRPGNGGPRRIGNVLVYRSQTLTGDVGSIDGMRITSPERTVVDLATTATKRGARRLLREALRLELSTAVQMAAAARKSNRRNSSVIAQLATRYARLPYARSKSDAEALALEVLHDAGIPQPRVNVKVAGEEADLVWPRLIVELDGPQFHLFKDEDARKQNLWEAAGFVVLRLPTDDLYEDPGKLLSLYRKMRPSA